MQEQGWGEHGLLNRPYPIPPRVAHEDVESVLGGVDEGPSGDAWGYVDGWWRWLREGRG